MATAMATPFIPMTVTANVTYPVAATITQIRCSKTQIPKNLKNATQELSIHQAATSIAQRQYAATVTPIKLPAKNATMAITITVTIVPMGAEALANMRSVAMASHKPRVPTPKTVTLKVSIPLDVMARHALCLVVAMAI